MLKENHVVHYLLLVLGIFVISVLFIFFRYNRPAEILLSALLSIYYIIWGIIHHKIEGRLTQLISLEYILMGSFVFLLLFTALTL